MTKNKKTKTKVATTQKNESIESKVIQMPQLGRQLTIRACSAPAGCDIDDWVRISSTAYQRLRRFASAFVVGFVLALLALCILFLPDISFDYAHRGEKFMAFFVKFLLFAVGFIGFSAAINTLIRDTVIYISPQAKCLVLARKLTLQEINTAIKLKDLEIAYIPPEGFLKKAQINIQFQNEWRTLAESYGTSEDIDELKTWLQALKS